MSRLDHPVVDATGLPGGWNFLMGWTPRGLYQPSPAAAAEQPDRAVGDAATPNCISVFDAVDRELGLKLVRQKRSIPVIVIDRVAEKPIE